MIEREPTDDVDALADELAELRREKEALERSEYERRQAEDALQRSEDKYRRLVEGLRRVCFFFACQPDGEITYVSPSVNDILGHEPRQMLGRLADLLVEDSAVNENALAEFRQLFSGEHQDPLLLEFRHADGDSRLLELVDVSAREEGGPRNGIAIDVTQRLRAETAILQSRDRFRRLAEALQDEYFFFERDRQGDITRVSGTVREVLGHDPEDFRDHFDDYLTDNPINDTARRALQRVLGGKPSEPYDIEIRDADGRERMLEICDLPRLDADGRVTAIDGLARDASARRRIEEALEWQVEADALALRNSARLMDATDDEGIDRVLESLGRLLEVDRVWLARPEPGAGLAVTRAWAEEDAEEEGPPALPFAPSGWSHRRLEATEPVGIPRVDGLPAEADAEREFLESRGVEAALWIPVVRNEELDAVLGIESIRGARGWTDRETRLVQRMAHDLAGTARRLALARETEELRDEATRLRGELDEEVDRRTADVREKLTRELETAREEAREKLDRLREEADREMAQVRAEAERRRAELEKEAEEREEQALQQAEERVRQAEEEAEERVRQAQEKAEERIRRAEEETEDRVRQAEEEIEQLRADAREELDERLKEAHADAADAREEAEQRIREAEEQASKAEDRARRIDEERQDAELRAADVDAEVERRLAEVRADLEEEIEAARRDAEEARTAAAQADTRARAFLRRPVEVLARAGTQGEATPSAVEAIARYLQQLVDPTNLAEPGEAASEIPVHTLVDDVASVLRLWAADRAVEITLLPPERPVVVQARKARLQAGLIGLCTTLTDEAESGDIALHLDVDEAAPALEVRATVARTSSREDPLATDRLSPELEALEERLTSAGGRLELIPSEDDIGEPWEAEAGAPGATRLRMTLPLEGVDAAPAELPAAGDLAGRRILVVDDHHGSRNALARALELQGMEVQTCGSGPAALAMFHDAAHESAAARESDAGRQPAAAPWDLLFIDWDMPGMDGIETTSRIEEHSGLSAPPAVLMGNPAEARDVRRRAELGGFAAHLIKPATGPTLADAASQALAPTGSDSDPGPGEPVPTPEPAAGVGAGPDDEVAGEPGGRPVTSTGQPPGESGTGPEESVTETGVEDDEPATGDLETAAPTGDLESATPTGEAGVTSDSSPESLVHTLDDMASALSSRQPRHCQLVVRRIRRQTWPPELEEDVEQLLALVERYRFRKAEEMVETLQRRLGS